MSSYGVGDFAETVKSHRIQLESPPVRVIAAWGRGSGMGEDGDRLGYAPTEWSGGFVMELADGRYAYATGWNDYSGWGCQDGASVAYYVSEPDLADLPDAVGEDPPGAVDAALWDREPVDLNRWIAAGMPDLYSPEFDARMRVPA